MEEMEFFITNLGNHHAVLGMAWLKKHNPNIDWNKELITFSSQFCNENCLEKKNFVQANKSPLVLELQGEDALPKEYQQFSSMFAQTENTPLPLHHPYDLSIELKAQVGTNLQSQSQRGSRI